MSFLTYLFTTTPGSGFRYYIPLLILAGLILVGGIVLEKLMTKNKALRKTFRGYPRRLNWTSILLFLALALRYERIPYLSIRFFLFLLLIWTIALIATVIRIYLKKYPAELTKENHKEMIHKTYSAKKN